MLFFVDETWQKVGDRPVGALGAVALPQESYNDFCSAIYGMKKAVLGAEELMQSELKGQTCFANRRSRRAMPWASPIG
jgi:hypothetical protein